MDSRVRALVAANLPEYRIHTITLLGAGEDHVAYDVNNDLVIRVAAEAEATEVERPSTGVNEAVREGRLLTLLARFSPLPVPQPLFVDADGSCLAYRRLPGVPLLQQPPPETHAHAAEIGARLGAFLAALHDIPEADLDGLVEVDDQPLADWLAEAAESVPGLIDRIPAAHHREIEEFLATPPPPAGERLAFSHNDLGIEHVLVDPGSWAVTGVIDWSDAALVDPAYDFGLIYRDLGPAGLAAALGTYPEADDNLVQRAVFYARCALFEDFAYGRPAYIDKSLTALNWMFRTGPA